MNLYLYPHETHPRYFEMRVLDEAVNKGFQIYWQAKFPMRASLFVNEDSNNLHIIKFT